MADVVSRQSLIDRLVALEGGKAYVREVYASFSDADLASAVESAELAMADVARYGRLGAVWQGSGGEMITSEDGEPKGQGAA